MYTLMTREYWDGDLMNPRYGEYFSAITMAQALKTFDFDGGCWETVEVKDDDRIIYCWKKKNYATFKDGIDALKYQLNVLSQALVSYANVNLTEDEKSKMYWITVHALNSGEDEAMGSAYAIRMRAMVSGNIGFIKEIEHLWEVI